ncbi:hypothetical protein GIB67_014623 [Kingdonia uniflora]|uniref:Uncharacterized protein n=1 Tax=Kingdonia uniflora TaxID=39325 RepID=A0A7J7NVC0_9MAGN|nr:hypothetical protein GIB67_014623 [Kingdonia uniflora]
MAFTSSSLQFSIPLSKPTPKFPNYPYSIPPTKKPILSFTTKAQQESSQTPETKPDTEPDTDNFENRLTNIRLRYKSGTGKKAEVRKSKKSKATGGAGNNNVFLPPVPLKEPVSAGLKVGFGFNPYTERLNGRLAGLGLTALLLVELGSGESVLRYHTPSIVFIQLYFVVALVALFIKFEKESVSIWP